MGNECPYARWVLKCLEKSWKGVNFDTESIALQTPISSDILRYGFLSSVQRSAAVLPRAHIGHRQRLGLRQSARRLAREARHQCILGDPVFPEENFLNARQV